METGNNRPQGHKKKVGQGSVSVASICSSFAAGGG